MNYNSKSREYLNLEKEFLNVVNQNNRRMTGEGADKILKTFRDVYMIGFRGTETSGLTSNVQRGINLILFACDFTPEQTRKIQEIYQRCYNAGVKKRTMKTTYLSSEELNELFKLDERSYAMTPK